MHPSPNTVARILATLAIAALLIPAAARGQTEATVWPHLTPAGFGLHIVGPGQSALQAWNYKPPTIAGATAHLQVRFLPDFRTGERIDVWVPKAGKPDERLPCIVIFYGGGWAGKVAGFQSDIAELVARGYVVAMPDYLLHAGEPVPSAIWDGARAIRWLRANAATYRIDPARIGVWGFSAGGWLVQYLAPSDEATVFPVTFKERRAKNEQFAVPMRILRWNADAAARNRREELGADFDILPSVSYIDYVPVGVVGVVGVIAAYNFSLHPVLLKIGAALAAGCTIVATPSQRTPCATLLLAPSTVRAFDEGKPWCAISLVTGCKAPRRSRLHEGTQPEGQACRFVDDALAAQRGT